MDGAAAEPEGFGPASVPNLYKTLTPIRLVRSCECLPHSFGAASARHEIARGKRCQSDGRSYDGKQIGDIGDQSATAFTVLKAIAARPTRAEQHGGADAIAPASGSERLHALLGSIDKELRIYPELRHELQNEREPARSMWSPSTPTVK